MKRFLACLLVLLLSSPALAQFSGGGTGAGFYPPSTGGGGGGAPTDATYVTITGNATLTNERTINIQSPLTSVDNGAGMSLDVGLGTVPLTKGGTNGTTAQAGTNNLLDGTGGAAAANGDIMYRTGGAWNRLAIGTANQVLTVSGGLPAWSTSAISAPSNAQYVTLATDATLSDERVLTGTANKITLTDGGAGGNITLNVGTDIVQLTASQTLTNKVLTSPTINQPVFGYHATNAMQLNNSIASQSGKIVWPDWSASRTLTILDPGGDANFVTSEGNATINGTKTFSDLKLSGTTFKTAANTITVPAATDTLVNLSSTQTLTNKELNTASISSADTLVFKQTSGNYNITSANPAATRTYSWYDAGGAGDIAIKTGTPTAGGIAYGDGNKIAFSTAGTSGQPARSGGSGAVTFGALDISSTNNVTNVLGQANGGTGQSSYTAGDILVANDSANLTKLAGGSDGQVLTYDSTQNPNIKWATGGGGAPSDAQYIVGALNGSLSAERVITDGTGITHTDGGANGNWTLSVANPTAKFGGDGSAGAVTKGATSDTITQINATTFSQTGSTTYTPDSGIIINCTSTATFSGTTTVGNLGNGMTAAPEATSDAGARGAIRNKGSYGGGGVSSTVGATYGGGGGGGGFGGAGGRGGNDGNAIVTGGLAGTAAPVNEFGTGGAGGSGGWGSAAGGAGGSKGGNLRVCAVGAISFANGCSVTMVGSAGAAGTGTGTGGGGGGAGGYGGFYSQASITFDTGSAVSANGGAGGSGSDSNGGKGGGGGGGRIIAMSPSNTVTVTPTVAGGSLGGTGVATNAAAGSAGVFSNISGTPNLPLIAHVERSAGMSILESVAWFRGELNNSTLALSHRQVGEVQAAVCANPGQFGNMFLTMMYGGKDKEQLSQMSAINLEDDKNLPVGEKPWQEYGITQTVMVDDAVGGRI